MSTDPIVWDQTYAFFLMEAPELLQTIEQDLLSLKADHSLNKIHNLMRTTHTLKGGAASLGLEILKKVAHSLEDVFTALYNPTVVIDSELEQLLFQAYECLRLPLTAELTNTSLNEAEVLNRAAAVFTQLREKLGDNSSQSAQIPTSAELGFDITQSIFETDVRKRLAALAAALVQPETEQVGMILRSSATVFVGLAEAFDLPGFGAIAMAVIAALDAHPDQAAIIAQIALADFLRGQALVLTGDRTRAGEPSVALQQLAGANACLVASKHSLSLDQIFGGATVEIEQQVVPEIISNSEFHNTRVPTQSVSGSKAPKESTAPAQTVRVDLERLERLNHLTGDLLTNQTQQSAANEQLQGNVQTLQEQVRRHEQTLNRIRDWSNRLLVRPEPQPSSAGQNLNNGFRGNSLSMEPDSELYVLLQSALEESVRLAAATGNVALLNQECNQTLEKQQQLLTDVRDDLTGTRMSPLGVVFSRLHRVLQQLVAVYGKSAELQLSGTDVLVDKTIAEKLYDTLLHLVRNAFDHGIESPEARRQMGKLETGQIRIHAYQQQRWTVIEVSDDGKGLDFEKILKRAMEMNLLSLEQTSSLSEEQILALLFEPGFSTASQVNDLSGRGFGLDVVRSQLQLLQGSITIQSEPQRGTTFTLQIPHTATMTKLDVPDPTAIIPSPASPPLFFQDELPPKKAQVPLTASVLEDSIDVTPTNLLVVPERRLKTNRFFVWRAGSTIFILPCTSIEEYLVPNADQIIQVQKQRFLLWREQMIPLYQLSELLSYNYPLPDATFGKGEDEAVLLLVLNHEQRTFAIESAITRLVTEPELVLKPFGAAIAPPSYTYGCTVIEDNRLVLVIDAGALLNRIIGGQSKD